MVDVVKNKYRKVHGHFFLRHSCGDVARVFLRPINHPKPLAYIKKKHCNILLFPLHHSSLSMDLTLFTAFKMLKPPKYSVVLSLDKSIRQHIGFLLKATDSAACIDSSVGQFRLQPWEARPHTQLHTPSTACSQHFILCDSPGGEKDIKSKNRDQTLDNTL